MKLKAPNLTWRTRKRLKVLGLTLGIFAVTALVLWLCWVVWLGRFVVYSRDAVRLDFDWQTPGPFITAEPPEELPINILYDDGTETVTGGDDGALLGVRLTAGTHTVVLTYRTPGQLLGVLISAVCLLLLAAPAAVRWILRRQKAPAAEEETPAETSPTEEIPEEETPAEAIPAEETPVEDTSVEETVAENTPAETPEE